MTREEVKKELVDFFKESNVEELSSNTSRIKIEEGAFNRVFYLESECIIFMAYIKMDNALMNHTITNAFLYSQIEKVEKYDKSIRFMLECGTLISVVR